MTLTPPDESDRFYRPDLTPRPNFEFSFMPLAAALVATIVVFGGIGYFLYQDATAKQRMLEAYAAAFLKLGITMPEGYTPEKHVINYLSQLNREPCDRASIKPFAAGVEQGGYPREGATVLEAFATRCRPSADILEPAFETYQRIGDQKAAVRVATALMRLDPAYTRWPYLRATAYEAMGDYQNALADYTTALALFQTTSNVVAQEFYRISRMFDALGRPCEAITPLETYISFKPDERRTDQLVNLMKQFAAKGNCTRTYANGSDRLLLQDGNNVVEVTIEGVRGRFIVDTGASLVSFTPDFARRALIKFDSANVVQTKTVGGTMQMALASVKRVSVGKVSAADVTVAIAPDHKEPYGPYVDGLLGMSFLARFDVSLSGGYLELRHRNLTQ